MGDQSGQGGELMVQPAAEKAHRQDRRRADPLQAFLEVGAVLFGHLVQGFGPQRGAGLGRDAVEIADHRFGGVTQRQRHIGAAVGAGQAGRAD